MEQRPILITAPTSVAWQRMVGILFRPFDLGKWCVLGFTAWIATLMEGGGSSQGNYSGGSGESGDEEFEEFFGEAKEWVIANLDWIIPVGIVLIVVLVALFVVLLWVSSRGKFMFLDNVVHNRALVGFPWKQYRVEGNSLFRWRLGFAAFTIVIGLLSIAPGAWAGYQLMESNGDSSTWIAVLVGAVLLFIGLLMLLAVIGLLLNDFVIPLMYRRKLKTTDAWRAFLPILRSRPGVFILYVLWRILLGIAAGITVLIAGFATCCIGFLILMIPYVGAVILLPVSVFFRSISLDFLRQFGPDFDVFTAEEFPQSLPA